MAEDGRPTIVLGVTGGIAAYKAAELARRLCQEGHCVKVVMTASAARLVAPLTFRTLTGEPVATSLWDENETAIHHISLAQEARLVVVAPATANIIAKMARGIADDILSTTLLATTAPILIAPAMNEAMYRHPATADNLAILAARGVVAVGPGTGGLACLDVGEGRMAEPAEILEVALRMLSGISGLAGKKVLVTAGGTREPIDAVRYIGNRSSGKMGYALAKEAGRRGAQVTLISGPTLLAEPPGVERLMVETADEMREAVLARAPEAAVVIMAAAVADFRPAAPETGKVKKERAEMSVRLERTADILLELGRSKQTGQVLVGFAAETENVLQNARGKLEAKGLDLIVANDVGAPGSGFEADTNSGYLVGAEGAEELPLMAKEEMARRILDRVEALTGGS